MTTEAIPHRSVFRAQEVCELAQVQAYVLRSWEAEFPDLGVSKTPEGPRLYRRADVELVLKLKHLLFVDGLTLAGARKQLIQEGVAAAEPEAEMITDADVAAFEDKQARKSLQDVREGLGWILEVLGGEAARSRRAARSAAAAGQGRKPRHGRSAKPVRSKGRPARAPKVQAKASRAKRTAGRKKR